MFDLLLTALLAISGTNGADVASSTTAQSEEDPVEIALRPGLMPVIQVFSDSRMKNFDVNIILAYSADGRVKSAELERSTGNSRLDRAICEWAKQIVLNAKGAGTTHLPLALNQP